MKSDVRDAAEDIRLIRQTLDDSQNTNFYRMKWEILILSLFVLIERLLKDATSVKRFMILHGIHWTTYHDMNKPFVLWSYLGSHRIIEISSYVLLGLLYAGMGVWLLIKRRRLKRATVIRSELLLYDVWCWALTILPAALHFLYAIGTFMRIEGNMHISPRPYINLSWLAIEATLFFLPMILTGIVLKKKWFSWVCAASMLVFIGLQQFAVNTLWDNFDKMKMDPWILEDPLMMCLTYLSHPGYMVEWFLDIKCGILLAVALFLIISSFVTRYKSRKAAETEETAEAARS